MGDYYDGTRLLSMQDADGNKPEVYICTTNRTGGKTTYFNRMLVNKFIKTGSKFGLLYRRKYELGTVADKFFKDINSLFFPEYTMTSKLIENQTLAVLYLNNKECGYAMPISMAEKIKKCSHLLNDCDRLLVDEFQSEDNAYVPNEVDKVLSIHTSIARGQGKQVRYVPLYLVGNPVTLLNPYYVSMDISTRIRNNTKFMRGSGWVLEQGFNESASNAIKNSGVMKAFSKVQYTQYASEAIYLNDNYAFIDKPDGRSRYVCTIKCNGNHYAIREYADLGFMYCDNKADMTFPTKIAVTTDDHNINYVMLKSNDLLVNNIRYLFRKGCFRFKNLECKDAVMKMLSY